VYAAQAQGEQLVLINTNILVVHGPGDAAGLNLNIMYNLYVESCKENKFMLRSGATLKYSMRSLTFLFTSQQQIPAVTAIRSAAVYNST